MATATAVKKAAPAKKVTETPAAIDWDSLPASEVVTYERATVATVDREETTPDAIKTRVTDAYNATAKANEVKHFNQACGSAAAAEKFLSLARLYAKSKGWTLRGKVITDGEMNILVGKQRLAPSTPSKSVVSYSVKDAETRTRLTDAQKAEIVKFIRKSPTNEHAADLAKTYDTSVQTVKKLAKDNGVTLPVGERGRKPAA